MKIYHSTDERLDFMRARAIADEHSGMVREQGGSLEAPNSPVQSPAILVLQLPDGIDPEQILPDIEFKEFVA